MSEPLLSVDQLTTVFDVPGAPVVAVDDVSFEIHQGETLGLVGESGSGKSVTAFSILQLLPPPGRVAAGRIVFRGTNLLAAPEGEMRRVRGAGIGLVFQEPMAALNPVMRVGDHIAEALTAHGLGGKKEARARAIELLHAVRITDPDQRVHDYPHQLSGGMRQRVMIAIALACRPPLVIADEPTTALDVTVQAQILDLLREMKAAFDRLAPSHHARSGRDCRCRRSRCGDVYGTHRRGGARRDIFRNPLHPYTRGLMASVPGGAAGTRLRAIDGTVPSLASLPPGCTFAARCPSRMDVCTTAVPALVAIEPQHAARCYLHSPKQEARVGPAVLGNPVSG